MTETPRSLVQQARRIAQLEARRRRLVKQLKELDSYLRLERRTLVAMTKPTRTVEEGKLE